MIINLNPFPVLTSHRLILRQLKNDDINELYNLRCNDIVNKYLFRSVPKSIDVVKSFIAQIKNNIVSNKCAYWAISLKNSPLLIGTICYWNIDTEKETVEIGYELNPTYHGLGIMQEAIEKVIEYGFSVMQVTVITAFPDKKNKSSVKLLKRNGFKQDLNFVYADKNDVKEQFIYFLINEKL
jgi:ribosomal-protein-alanine N-acetyltransferase